MRKTKPPQGRYFLIIYFDDAMSTLRSGGTGKTGTESLSQFDTDMDMGPDP
ncbi:unnamed protein product, partial [marine sediment metagenome]